MTVAHSGLDPFDELFEDADIESAGSDRFGVELGADGEPVEHFAFDGFDDSVWAASGDSEAVGESVDSHMVSAGDANFAFAVDASEDGVGFDDEGVSVIGIVGVFVGDRVGDIDWDVVEEISTLLDIEELETGPDTEDGHASVGDFAHEESIERFAAWVHGANGVVEHVAIVAGVEIGTADENDTMDDIEEMPEIFFLCDGGEDDWNSTGGSDAIVVAGGEKTVGWGWRLIAKVSVDSNQWLWRHTSILPD